MTEQEYADKLRLLVGAAPMNHKELDVLVSLGARLLFNIETIAHGQQRNVDLLDVSAAKGVQQ